MPSGKRTVQIYEELAGLEEQRAAPQMRDRFLILAADAALTHGLRDEAERLRARLLQSNPHHLLRPYPSMPEALKSSDVSNDIADLRHTYPPDEAARRLGLLQAGQEELEETVPGGATYPSDEEPPSGDEPPIYRFAAPGEL